MVKKKQPCTHFYCFIVSIIAALFKFYTKSVKIIDKIFFRVILAALLEDFRKILAPVLHIRIVAAAVKVALMTPLSSSIYAFSSLSLSLHQLFFCVPFSLFFLHSLALILFFSNNGPSPFELFAGPHSLLWHLRCDGEQLFPVINCYERGHLSQLTELNQGKKYYWCWRCCWLEYEWAILLWTADEQIGVCYFPITWIWWNYL